MNDLVSITVLGFFSGLPLALLSGTMQAWLTGAHVDLTTISIFSLLHIFYAIKFFWAPVVETHQRRWQILSQLTLSFGLFMLASIGPERRWAFVAAACLVAFASATQDIVIDAYRSYVLKPQDYGTGSAWAQVGYRLGMLVSGAGAMMLAEYFSWSQIYIFMGCVMLGGVLATLCSREPESRRSIRPHSMLEPFFDIMKRKHAFSLMSFILLYKSDVVLTVALMTPFFLHLGFGSAEIGIAVKGFGLAATLLGGLVGGMGMARLGLRRALVLFGILQSLSGLSFYFLALYGKITWLFYCTIALESFCSGMGSATYAAFLLSICTPAYAATQFALVSSGMAVTRTVLGASAGFLVTKLDWPWFYLFAMVLGLPALGLLMYLPSWEAAAIKRPL